VITANFASYGFAWRYSYKFEPLFAKLSCDVLVKCEVRRC
jgi:hypothetical protein